MFRKQKTQKTLGQKDQEAVTHKFFISKNAVKQTYKSELVFSDDTDREG